jgi:hypothetical protein
MVAVRPALTFRLFRVVRSVFIVAHAARRIRFWLVTDARRVVIVLRGGVALDSSVAVFARVVCSLKCRHLRFVPRTSPRHAPLAARSSPGGTRPPLLTTALQGHSRAPARQGPERGQQRRHEVAAFLFERRFLGMDMVSSWRSSLRTGSSSKIGSASRARMIGP